MSVRDFMSNWNWSKKGIIFMWYHFIFSFLNLNVLYLTVLQNRNSKFPFLDQVLESASSHDLWSRCSSIIRIISLHCTVRRTPSSWCSCRLCISMLEKGEVWGVSVTWLVDLWIGSPLPVLCSSVHHACMPATNAAFPRWALVCWTWFKLFYLCSFTGASQRPYGCLFNEK